MVKVRLFAQAADVVNGSVIDVDHASLGAGSVSSVTEFLRQQYGQKMADVLDISQIWLNGKPADESLTVNDSDEVAIIPPVSGG